MPRVLSVCFRWTVFRFPDVLLVSSTFVTLELDVVSILFKVQSDMVFYRVTDTYQNNLTTITATNDHYECPDGTGPYIPISECITGVRAQVSHSLDNHFFDISRMVFFILIVANVCVHLSHFSSQPRKVCLEIDEGTNW